MPSLRRARSAKPAEPSRTTQRRPRVRGDLDGPARVGLHEQLAVDLDRDRSAVGQDLDAEALLGAEHDRAVEEAVRRVGRDDHRPRLGRDDRAAGGVAVGRRARGGGGDDAVAGVADQQLAVDVQRQQRLAATRDAAEDDVVEGHVLGAGAVRAPLRAEHEALLDGVVAGTERLEALLQVLAVDLGEVAQAAEVGAEHGHAERRGQAQAAEHRPVAAEREHDVAAVGELVDRAAAYRVRQAPVLDGGELHPGPLRPRGDLADGHADVAPRVQHEAHPPRRGRLPDRRGRCHRRALQHTAARPTVRGGFDARRSGRHQPRRIRSRRAAAEPRGRRRHRARAPAVAPRAPDPALGRGLPQGRGAPALDGARGRDRPGHRDREAAAGPRLPGARRGVRRGPGRLRASAGARSRARGASTTSTCSSSSTTTGIRSSASSRWTRAPGDYVRFAGRSYRRPVLGAHWILEHFPA